MPYEWFLTELDPSKILNHEVNLATYGDTPDPEFIESVRTLGVTHPIHVVPFGKAHICLSGHRRKQAARIAGHSKIRVLLCRTEMSETDQEIFLVESNRQREKTAEQRAREFRVLEAAYAKQAAARMTAGKNASIPEEKTDSDPVACEATGSKKGAARASDRAAKEVGMNRHTAKAAGEVIDMIDAATAAGDVDKAASLRHTLNEESVAAAHRQATNGEAVPEAPEPTVDHFKVAVDPDFAEAFGTLPEFRSMLARIAGIKSDLLELAGGPGGRWLDKQEIEQHCDNLRRAVRFGIPYTECGRCKRDKKVRKECKSCKGRGWVCEMAYKTHSDEDRKWIANRK